MRKTSYILALLLVITDPLPAFANDMVTMKIQNAGKGSYILTAKQDEIYGVQSLDVEVDYDSSKLEYPLVPPINGGELMDIRADSPGKLILSINREVAHNVLQINLDFTQKWDAPDGVTNVYALVVSRTDTPIPIDSDEAYSSDSSGNGSRNVAGANNSGTKVSETAPAISGPMQGQFFPTNGDRKSIAATVAPSAGSALLARYAGKVLAGEMGFLIRDERSVLERFKKFTGQKSLESFVALFGRSDHRAEQNPVIALSDGKTPVTIKMDIRPDGSRNGGIALVGATLISKEAGDKGINITVLPREGTCNASLVLVSGDEIVSYHMAVAPPADITGDINENNFLEALQGYISSLPPELRQADERYLPEYIFTANYLVSLDKKPR